MGNESYKWEAITGIFGCDFTIIDVQVHIFRRIGKDPVWNPSYPPEMLIRLMEGAGVDKAILISYEPGDILPDLAGDPLGTLNARWS